MWLLSTTELSPVVAYSRINNFKKLEQRFDRSGELQKTSERSVEDKNLITGTTVFDFESGSFSSDWTKTSNFDIRTDRIYKGNYSAGQRGSTIDAELSPQALLGGRRISAFEFFWQEESNQSGFTTQLIDSNGNEVVAMGGNNPQWEIRDGSGDNEIFGGNGYDRWIHYRIEFDWQASQHTYFYKDLSSNTTRSGTRSLSRNTNIEKFRINNNIWGSASYMWLDNITFEL
jgi:hypothetical protein